MTTARPLHRRLIVGVPVGVSGVASRLRAAFDGQGRAGSSVDKAQADDCGPGYFEQLEPRWLLAAAKIAIIGSSSVEGVVDPNNASVAVNSFRRPLWQMMNQAGYDVDFIGSKNTNQDGLPPRNNDFDTSNEGRSGFRADHFLTGRNSVPSLATLLQGNTHDGQPYRPDIALIYVGHNDIFGSTTDANIATTAKEIGQIVDVLRARNPNVVVIIGLLHDSGSEGGRFIPAIGKLNQQLIALAQAKTTATAPVRTADINTGFDPSVYTFDGQHANPQGEQFMAERWFDALQQVVAVVPASGLKTSETGGSATFGVRLALAPTANVTLTVSSSNTSEGVINKTTLTFTPSNWDQAQTVTVTGVDDSVRDGDKTYSIVFSRTQSNDPLFDNRALPGVSVTNTDNEGAIGGNAFVDLNANGNKDSGESGLAGVRVYLDLNGNGQQDSNEPSRTTDSSGSYLFDAVAAGPYSVRVIPPAGYTVSAGGSGVKAVTVTAGNTASTAFALGVVPGSVLLAFAGPNVTTEDGGKATLTVRLGKAPTQDVSITLASSNTSEGTLSKITLVFSPQNWNDPQSVVVTGVDDAALDGHKDYTINVTTITSNDPAYKAVTKPSIAVSNRDNESSIRGTVFFDANGNGQIDTGETRFSGTTVFLDTNANARFDPGERSATTNSSGGYDFGVLASGDYVVRILPPSGYVPPTSDGQVQAPAGTTLTQNFGLIRPVDTAGNTPDTARPHDLASPTQVIEEYLTDEDRLDYYRVRVRKNRTLRITLKRVDTDVRLQLLDESGRRVRSSSLRKAGRQIVATSLPRGSYIIRVFNRDAVPTAYRIHLVSR